MTVAPLQSNLPLVRQDGSMTEITEQAFLRMVAELQALRTTVNDHETRITALEP